MMKKREWKNEENVNCIPDTKKRNREG